MDKYIPDSNDYAVEIDLADGCGWSEGAQCYDEAVDIARKLERLYPGDQIQNLTILDDRGREVEWS